MRAAELAAKAAVLRQDVVRVGSTAFKEDEDKTKAVTGERPERF